MDIDALGQLSMGGIFAILVIWVVFQFVLKMKNGKKNGNGNGNGKAVEYHDIKETIYGIKNKQELHIQESKTCFDDLKGSQKTQVDEQKQTNLLLTKQNTLLETFILTENKK